MRLSSRTYLSCILMLLLQARTLSDQCTFVNCDALRASSEAKSACAAREKRDAGRRLRLVRDVAEMRRRVPQSLQAGRRTGEPAERRHDERDHALREASGVGLGGVVPTHGGRATPSSHEGRPPLTAGCPHLPRTRNTQPAPPCRRRTAASSSPAARSAPRAPLTLDAQHLAHR